MVDRTYIIDNSIVLWILDGSLDPLPPHVLIFPEESPVQEHHAYGMLRPGIALVRHFDYRVDSVPDRPAGM